MAVCWSKIESYGLKQAVAAPPPPFGGCCMQKSMLYGHTDCSNTIYSIRMPQNLQFMNKIGKKLQFLDQTFNKQFTPPPRIRGCWLQKTKLQGHTEHKNTICRNCIHENVPF